MNEKEMFDAFHRKLLVRIVNHDYEMEGYIVCVFNKYVDTSPGHPPGPYGDVRCVVQDDRRLLFIQSGRNLERVT
jgi:hypothetical protein